MHKLFPAAPPAPAAAETSGTLPASDRPAGVGCGDAPGTVANRVEAFFDSVVNGHGKDGRVPVGVSD
jgi:hypothetical protein